MMSSWNDPELTNLFLKKTPLIDVRAPVEFLEGKIPHSVNLPIINNEERALIGTCYKEHGQKAAIELGHQLVQGHTKDQRVNSWRKFFETNPEAEVFCFRGGLRSQTSCEWLKDFGIVKTPIEGGYKRLRNYFLSWLNEGPLPLWLRISGPTGTGKTQFLSSFPHVDLEKLANHRGSSFGNLGEQPCQITFENELALKLIEMNGIKHLVEDESATIGKISLPKRIYVHLRNSPIIVLKVDREERIANIFDLYVRDQEGPFFLAGLDRIQKALGGVNYQAIRKAMEEAFQRERVLSSHEEWIALLLDHYYDPIYARGLSKQAGEIIFEGDPGEVTDFLRQQL